MKNELAALRKKIQAAIGSDRALDAEIARVLDEPDSENPGGPDTDNLGGYTGSVDACIALIGRAAPHWHWHVGHGPSGILPYAALTKEPQPKVGVKDQPKAGAEAGVEEAANGGEKRVEVSSTTVPLALLGALIEARISEQD